jgi:hypothetical protein
LPSRADVVFEALIGEDFLDRYTLSCSNVEDPARFDAEQVCLPDIVNIDVIADAGSVWGWVVSSEDGDAAFLCPEMILTAADIEIPEDAVIHSAVHDDPFAY